jgi:hypothetical protein
MSDAFAPALLALPCAKVRVRSGAGENPPWPHDRRHAVMTAVFGTALILVAGCGGANERALEPAGHPPATAKERAQANPRMRADLESNSKKKAR